LDGNLRGGRHPPRGKNLGTFVEEDNLPEGEISDYTRWSTLWMGTPVKEDILLEGKISEPPWRKTAFPKENL
jgi:hypothetical protein